MPGLHSTFGPSSAARIIECPASYLLTKDLPDRPSKEAAQGTVAHFASDESMTRRILPWSFLNLVYVVVEKPATGDSVVQLRDALNREDGYNIVVDEEMVIHVENYIAHCRSHGGEQFTERRVNISRWTPIPDQFGTSDFIVCKPGYLKIIDLKYGKGVRVFAKDNWQAILYALGVIDELDWLYDFDEIEIEIYQPRLDHIDVWKTTKAELLKAGDHARVRMELATYADAPFGPSKHACQFCKIRSTCKPLADYIGDNAALAFDEVIEEFDVEQPQLKLLPVEALVAAWHRAELYDIRIKAVLEELTQRLNSGESVPGLKLVEGRANRKFRDEDAVKRFFDKTMNWTRDTYLKEKLLGPKKLLDRVPPGQRGPLEALIYKLPGKPKLAPETDKRPDYRVANLSAFDEVEDDETDG